MNILIVDDEPLARARLKRLLINQNWPFHHEASNANEALALVKKCPPDLVFLDVDMPGMNGLEVASELNKLPIAPAIIFVTAHPEHALDALQLNAAGYLVKPVSAVNLENVLAQVGRLNKVQLQKQHGTKISYQLGGTLKSINIESVYYFCAEEKYTKMVFKDGEALIEQSLKQLVDSYPVQLLRIHRNTLINRHRLVALHTHTDGSHFVELQGCSEHLSISRRELKAVKQAL